MKKYNISLFIFRRDLRIEDNTALIEALKSSHLVIPIFILDSRQIIRNKYKSENAIQFMVESLLDLDDQLRKYKGKLYIFFGIAEKVISKLIKQQKIDALYFNKDYSPFSIKRDKSIKRISKENKIPCHSFDDLLLCPPGSILKPNHTPYTIFTPFYKKAITYKVVFPQKNKYKNYFTAPIKDSFDNPLDKLKITINENLAYKGGQKNCKKIFYDLSKFKNYEKERNYPSLPTTGLSAHNKFGTCSIREVYFEICKKLGISHPLIRQLYWRDFFTQIVFYFPHVLGAPFHKDYEKIKWSKNNKLFKAWCEGNTGFPIVDAGMRQLNQTGFMHNRVRMITASFLIKDLHIDWKIGEKYFSQKLLDYDPALNNGNWQWIASTGADSQPYFRIFNPWIQQKKFDPECTYIKKWVPELKNIDNKTIHNWYKTKNESNINYSYPIIDHDIEAKKAIEAFRSLYKKHK